MVATSTTEQILAEMLLRAPGDSIGRAEAVSSLTVTTVVCSALATGSVSAQKYIGKWLYRPNTATLADRYRLCTNFAAATGTLTHAGTNYVDTTATGETVYILEYEPSFYLNAINVALSRSRWLSAFELPVISNEERYWLPTIADPNSRTSHADWIQQPGHIWSIHRNSSPVLSRNRYFSEWGAYQTLSTLAQVDTYAPDWWYCATTTSSVRRTVAVDTRKGGYEVTLDGTTNAVQLDQNMPLPVSGGTGDSDSWNGRSITAVLVARTSFAAALGVRLVPSTGGSAISSSHSGSGLWETLTATLTVPTGTTQVTLRILLGSPSGEAVVSECYAYEGAAADLNDNLRRNDYPETDVGWRPQMFETVGAQPVLILPRIVRPGQYIVRSQRPYARFDATRFAAALIDDTTTTDAPRELIAMGALGRLYEGLAERQGQDNTRYRELAAEFNHRWEKLATSHRYSRGNPPVGLNLPQSRLLAAVPPRW